MPQILLVNPSKRKTRRKTSTRKNPVKKRRTAAQKAATRKLVALNKRRRGGSTRRKNPVKRTARRKPARRRAAPAARKRRRSTRRRSNPALNMRSVKNQVIEAGTGAAGAIALDVVQGYLPIPANLKGGIVGTLVKAGLAIGIGVLGSKTKLVSYSTASKMANGALTVVLHDELKKQIAVYAPGIQMGEYMGEYVGADLGYYGAGLNPDEDVLGGPYLPELDSESMSFQQDGMGEYEGVDYMDDMAYG